MNYIKQLTAVCVKFTEDDRLNASHVSIYLALFQIWNVNRFNNPISVSRMDVMKISKIGSKATYHKCLKELDYWGYIKYIPSHNPLKGSKIKMFKFETTPEQEQEQVLVQNEDQVVVPSINNVKNKNNTKQLEKRFIKPTLSEIMEIIFRKEEAEKFLNYYESKGWKIGGRSPMKNWRAAAKNWMLNFEKFNPNQNTSNLHINQEKDYEIPL
jgi:hypothetical protein